MKFTRPTLVTITAPTCSGKSILQTHLTEVHDFERIVSTTTRPPRSGEVEGVDYYFISNSASLGLELAGEFLELVTLDGVRYGVTRAEIAAKKASNKTLCVIIEPSGIPAYTAYCATNGLDMFKLWVELSEVDRIDRLTDRTVQNVLDAPKTDYRKVVNAHCSRLLSILGDERTWFGRTTPHLSVPGDDLVAAVALIQTAINVA